MGCSGKLQPAASRQRQGDYGPHRPARHGRHVAQIDRQGLAPYAARANFAEPEIDVVRKEVDRDEAFARVAQP
jgi:hypothetical protein